jgi:glutamyl-tRNA synthetase
MDNKIRLRFAPSPTGFMHIGNLRTAIFAYLLSESMKGSLILRIEDTDQKREVDGSVESLLKVLDWVGIKFSEGPHVGGDFGPYTQTERLSIYQKYIQELIEKGGAYHCFCSKERLDLLREEQKKEKKAPRYDLCCRNLSKDEVSSKIKKGESFVIRQKMPTNACVEVKDEIRGKITFKSSELDDHVLIKSNGVPTYQFANIVDDHLMKVSHVTRGDEWLASFPKNILLYQSFGWEAPKYIHFPLILNKGGGKLSKRQGDVFVEDYIKKGYLPEAIINFCALLGWNPKNDQEILSIDELIEKFDVKGMGASPAVFDIEKINYLNGYYIRKKSTSDLVKLCQPYLIKSGLISQDFDKESVFNAIEISKDRLKKIEDISDMVHYLFVDKIFYEPSLLIWKNLSLEEVKSNLSEIYNILDKIEEKDWNKKNLEEIIFSYIKANDKKNGDYLWPMRVSLSGEKNSPSPMEIAWVIGKSRSLKRIKNAIDA